MSVIPIKALFYDFAYTLLKFDPLFFLYKPIPIGIQ